MHFLRLIRPLNLLLVILTMIGVFVYGETLPSHQDYEISILNFALLVLSTVVIAAAGNIINDYFDVKADRINRPERLVITKHIKRRWAIVIHWFLNFLGFSIGVYLSIYYETFIFAFIHLISINLLWFYSIYFKKKVLIGNVLISILTALVPFIVWLYLFVSPNDHNSLDDPSAHHFIFDIEYNLILFLIIFAFIQNLAREIVKDAQDITGDKVIYVKSLPMVIGTRGALNIVSLLLLILPVGLSIFLSVAITPDLRVLIPLALASICNIMAIIISYFNSEKKLLLINILIKTAMFFGISMVYTILIQ